MINQQEYKSLLERAAKRKFKNININWGSWYTQFLYYETMWETYFLDFITDYSKLTTKPEIQFVFWESCPGGMPFPHQNYAFDSSRYNNPIDGNYDKYLTRVCDNFSIVWKGTKVHYMIGELIKFLGGQGVIIIDLYPTHGVTLKKENRQKLFDEVFAEYSIKKLTRIGNLTNGFPKSSIVNITSELWSAGFNGISHATSTSIENALLLTPPLTFNLY